MNGFATTTPDNDPALQRQIVESRAQLRRPLFRSERGVESLSALLFVAAAIAVALIGHDDVAMDWPLAGALVFGYALASRIEFHMGSVWTDPSQLFLVPMLLLLPTQLVPLLVAAGLLLSRVPEYLRGSVSLGRAAIRLADASYSLWPAAVLLIAGATTPDWSDWPIYLVALATQFALEFATTSIRVWLSVGVPPRKLVPDARATCTVDALLSPIGLLAAMAAVDDPLLALLLLPLLGLIRIFAREREARIENAMTLSAAYRGTAHLLGELLSDSHEYTGEHSRSVVVLAHRVGQRLDLNEMTLREIEFGALLHDVGKLAVSKSVLDKPGPLDADELEHMRTHPAEGERMLDRIGGVLGEVGTVVRSHHERWDGTGYPDGLAGEQIPIAARVISACDAFNAMTTDRPYRAALTTEAAVAELRTHAGSQFDPEVVDVLITVVHASVPEAAAEERDEIGAAIQLLLEGGRGA